MQACIEDNYLLYELELGTGADAAIDITSGRYCCEAYWLFAWLLCGPPNGADECGPEADCWADCGGCCWFIIEADESC